MSVPSDARVAIVSALETLGWVVYAYPPAVPIPPCLVLASGSPWQEPVVVGGRYRVTLNYRVMCVVPDGGEYLPMLEDMTQAVVEALPSYVQFDVVTTPAQLDTGAQGSVLAADVLISATYTDTPEEGPIP